MRSREVEVDSLARGIATWLAGRQRATDGRVTDSVHQETGTYADGFAALAFTLLGWIEPRDRALKCSLDRPLDSEFDSLAQSLILEVCPGSLSEHQCTLLKDRPLASVQTEVSNNWAIFRGFTRLLRAASGDFSLLTRQLPSGLFPDSPEGQACPVCYHAKICATLGLMAVLRPAQLDTERLLKGLRALVDLISPNGLLVPYGRSRGTLFGYGAAYLALRLGAAVFNCPEFSWAAAVISGQMARHVTPDGHIPAVLGQDEWLRADWDIYINNPDYNAFACACLLLAAKLAPDAPVARPPGSFVRSLGPLLVARQSEMYFACSTTGEFSPYVSPFFADTRYAGLTPLVFDCGPSSCVFDTGYCWDGRESTRKCLGDPSVSDWIPYLQDAQRIRYWAQVYDDVQWDWTNETLTLTGHGSACWSRPVSRWSRFWQSRVRKCPALQMSRVPSNGQIFSALRCDFSEKTLSLSCTTDSPDLCLRRAEKRVFLTAPLA